MRTILRKSPRKAYAVQFPTKVATWTQDGRQVCRYCQHDPEDACSAYVSQGKTCSRAPGHQGDHIHCQPDGSSHTTSWCHAKRRPV
jgi:hypothetical protein